MQKQKNKFKQTEIGTIPEDWGFESLEKISNYINRGLSPKYVEKGIPVLNQKCVRNGTINFVDIKYHNLSANYSKDKLLQDFDLLINSTGVGTLGRSASVKDKIKIPTLADSHLTIVRINQKKADSLFVLYFLNKIRPQIENLGEGTSGQQELSREQVKKIQLPFPPLPEQRSIAKILSDLDAKIELNNKMNQTLEAIGHALFNKWFVEERKEDWEIVKLRDYADIIKGVSYRSDELKESAKALVTLKSMNRGGGLNKNGFKEYVGGYKKEQEIIDGDIVVAYTDLTQRAEVIGRPAIVRTISKYCALIASLDLAIIRPKNNQINNTFLYYLLYSEDFQNYVQGFTNGTTVLHLSSKAIPEYSFALPSKESIFRFGEIVGKLLNKKKENEAENEILMQIRDSLLPKLMSGEIRVN